MLLAITYMSGTSEQPIICRIKIFVFIFLRIFIRVVPKSLNLRLQLFFFLQINIFMTFCLKKKKRFFWVLKILIRSRIFIWIINKFSFFLRFYVGNDWVVRKARGSCISPICDVSSETKMARWVRRWSRSLRLLFRNVLDDIFENWG